MKIWFQNRRYKTKRKQLQIQEQSLGASTGSSGAAAAAAAAAAAKRVAVKVLVRDDQQASGSDVETASPQPPGVPGSPLLLAPTLPFPYYYYPLLCPSRGTQGNLGPQTPRFSPR